MAKLLSTIELFFFFFGCTVSGILAPNQDSHAPSAGDAHRVLTNEPEFLQEPNRTRTFTKAAKQGCC